MTLSAGLHWAVETCRLGTDGALRSFLRGEPLLADVAGEIVPAEILADLEFHGLLEHLESSRIALAVRCDEFNRLVSIMPARQVDGADAVHINIDSLWLAYLTLKHGDPGEYAAELGTGNGIVAAHLVAKYRRVIATDLVGSWLGYAKLTLEANKARGRPTAVVACDVGSALRTGAFDLVAANPPWSPAVPLDADNQTVTYADGGPTGTELPARFMHEATRLLRPGGTSITLCLDTTFDDGSRPLMKTVDEIGRSGFDVTLIESAVFDTEMMTQRLRDYRIPSLVKARHLAVVLKRPR